MAYDLKSNMDLEEDMVQHNVSYIYNEIYTNKLRNNYTLLHTLDITKAYDSVIPEILEEQ